MGTRSHLLQLYPIVEKLLDNGHKVTGVYFNSAKIKHENYTEILIENFMEDKMKDSAGKYMGNFKKFLPLLPVDDSSQRRDRIVDASGFPDIPGLPTHSQSAAPASLLYLV